MSLEADKRAQLINTTLNKQQTTDLSLSALLSSVATSPTTCTHLLMSCPLHLWLLETGVLTRLLRFTWIYVVSCYRYSMFLLVTTNKQTTFINFWEVIKFSYTSKLWCKTWLLSNNCCCLDIFLGRSVFSVIGNNHQHKIKMEDTFLHPPVIEKYVNISEIWARQSWPGGIVYSQSLCSRDQSIYFSCHHEVSQPSTWKNITSEHPSA